MSEPSVANPGVRLTYDGRMFNYRMARCFLGKRILTASMALVCGSTYNIYCW
jgi:hypothetical protein